MDYLQMLDKKDVALLYRTLRDSIKERIGKVPEVTEHEWIVLGKLKIILNVMD